MAARKKLVKKKNYPQLIRKKKRPDKPRGKWYRAFRERVDAIMARHRARRAALDQKIRGADMTSLAYLDVVVFPRGKPRPMGIQRLMKMGQEPDEGSDRRYDPDTDGPRPMSPIAPPVPFQKDELAASGRQKKAA